MVHERYVKVALVSECDLDHLCEQCVSKLSRYSTVRGLN